MAFAKSSAATSRRFASARKHILNLCAGIALTASLALAFAALPAGAATLKHQASGTIESHTPSQIVLLHAIGKNKVQWNFVLTSATQIPPGVNKGIRATIYYHDDNGRRVADRIKVVAVTPAKSK